MVKLTDVLQAKKRLGDVITETPLEYSHYFSSLAGCDVFAKYENFRETRAFKIRGAYNKIMSLTEQEKQAGVIAASCGSHALGVSLASQLAGINATICMPETASREIVGKCREYGAEVLFAGEYYDQAWARALELHGETKAPIVSSFDDPEIIAGQGTIALEILQRQPDIDTIIAPIGGGGLIAGLGVAAKAIKPDIKLIGVEAENAPKMYRSIKEGRIVTLESPSSIADKIVVRKVGTLTYEIAAKTVDEIILVDDESIMNAMYMYLNKANVLVEGAGAASLAALLSGKLSHSPSRVALVVSGGNVNPDVVNKVIERGLLKTG